MKKIFLAVCVVPMLLGCSGLKTREIHFYCDPNANQGIDILVNVIYLDANTRYVESELKKIKSPDEWFGAHDLYNKVSKAAFDVRPSSFRSGRPSLTYRIPRTNRKRATGIIVIAEYGKRKLELGSRTLVYLSKRNDLEPKPNKTEYIYIGEGYMKRQKKSFWGMGRYLKDIPSGTE